MNEEALAAVCVGIPFCVAVLAVIAGFAWAAASAIAWVIL